MVRWRTGTVATLRRQWTGAVELDVDLPDGTRMRALAYPELVGTPEPGDRVLLNASALLMGLGTGGYALVVALPDRLPPDPPDVADTRDAGHLVKARYTPLQPILLGVDEEASPHRDVLADADDLDGLPVVTADLHSALPAILAGIRADAPQARVAYLLTDGGALPAWFSRTLAGLRSELAGTITVGQAFGGDLEATTLHGGLLAARHVLHADVAIVAQGPGNLGTGTRWGSPASPSARRSTRSPHWAADRSARYASPTPTPAPATGACPTTASPRTAGWRSPRRSWWCPRTWRRPSRPRCTRRWLPWRPGTASSGCSSTVSTPHCGPAPCRCPPWAAVSTAIRRTSWRPPPPAATR